MRFRAALVDTLVSRSPLHSRNRAPAIGVLTFVDDQPIVRDFELVLSPGVDVFGRVVDETTGAPVAGALVTVESATGEVGRVLSDDAGRFEVDRIELDTYLVKVQHIAYGAQTSGSARLLGSVRNVGDLVAVDPGRARPEPARPLSTGQMRLCIEGRRTATGRCDSDLVGDRRGAE